MSTIQTKQEFEKFYENPDPYGYIGNADDARRKEAILSILAPNHYRTAIDIGCGEGFITRHLPATLISGMDISENAKARLPSFVIPVKEPVQNSYDLIVSTDTMYAFYDYIYIKSMIFRAAGAGSHILIGGIDSKLVEEHYFGEVLKSKEFSYKGEYYKIILCKIN